MSNSITQKQRIESLYVLKALCSFLVVVVHTELWGKSALTPLMGIATPCFLAITGFLLYSDDRERELYKAAKWSKKTFGLSLACNALYLAFYLFDGAPLSRYSAGVLFLNLFTGHIISTHLWYLTAVWQGLLLFRLLIRYAPKFIAWAPLLYIIAYILRAYGKQLLPELDSNTLFIMRANAIVTALPFLTTGYLVHQYSTFISARLRRIPLALICIIILAYVEYAMRTLTGAGSIFLLSTWPLVVALLLFCNHFSSFTLPLLGYVGRFHSANVYYFHILILIGCNRWFPELRDAQAILVYTLTLPVSFLFNVIHKCLQLLTNRIKACQATQSGV